jgi:hypothetical protein
MGSTKRVLLLALAAALLVAALLAAPAGAQGGSLPCRNRIYNEWYGTGKISTTYPIACYHDALNHIPSDARVYSNLGADIKAALVAALARQRHHGSGPTSVGSGSGLGTPHDTKAAVKVKSKPPRAVGAGSVSDNTGDPGDTGGGSSVVADPAASSGSGSGLPLPILVLVAVAILLAAAGAVGTGVRYVRRRGAS